MSRILWPRRSLGRGWPERTDRALSRGQELVRSASSGWWWVAAGAVLVLGGAAAGLHAPSSGADFWHVADGALLRRDGLGATASYLFRSGVVLDTRSWLFDLGLFLIYKDWGVAGLEVAGAIAGAVLGLLLLQATRSDGRAHPALVVVAGGLGLAALAAVLTDLPSLALALLAALLLLTLAGIERRGIWGAGALGALVVVWTNTQADAFLAVLVIWGWLGFAHWDASRPGRPPAPSWWLVPITGLALLLSPRGLGTFADLPLSLGMSGEHPLLAAWSSIDFHPWSARLAELTGMLLLLAYWVAGPRLRRADAYLGLVTAALALLWSNYLPWFLVVALAQSSWYLSVPGLARAGGSLGVVGGAPERAAAGGWVRAASAIPVVVALGALSLGSVTAAHGGGARGQTAADLPVSAAQWLADHPAPGGWFTTPSFGDYLSARFPTGHHLLCLDDPLPLAGRPLTQCQALTVLNAGALGQLGALGARLAVLPRTAPQSAFLLAEGWEIRYRDPTSVILAPRNL